MSVFAGHGDITPLQIWDGVVGHAIEGDRTTLAIVELAPNCAIPEHHRWHLVTKSGAPLSGRRLQRAEGEALRLKGQRAPVHVFADICKGGDDPEGHDDQKYEENGAKIPPQGHERCSLGWHECTKHQGRHEQHDENGQESCGVTYQS